MTKVQNENSLEKVSVQFSRSVVSDSLKFLTVTPGVRFADGDIGDQKRVMTPAEAKRIGSDYIVVGRPITAAADPVAAYERCCAEFIG